MIKTSWTLLCRLLTVEFPPQISLAVLLDEISMELAERERKSRYNGYEANSGQDLELEVDVAHLQAYIVTIIRRNLWAWGFCKMRAFRFCIFVFSLVFLFL